MRGESTARAPVVTGEEAQELVLDGVRVLELVHVDVRPHPRVLGARARARGEEGDAEQEHVVVVHSVARAHRILVQLEHLRAARETA